MLPCKTGPTSTWLQCLVSALLLTPILATRDAYMSSREYNAGMYGPYITQTFRSSPIVAARPNFMIPYSNCDDGMKLFVAPHGDKVQEIASPNAMMFDTKYVSRVRSGLD